MTDAGENEFTDPPQATFMKTESGENVFTKPAQTTLAKIEGQEAPDRSVFVQRGSEGPYRQNLGTSLTTPLSADVRAELQHLIETAATTSARLNQLHELLDSEMVTAWATRGEHEVVESMARGDLVVYVDSGGTRGERDVRHVQEIDLALPRTTTDQTELEVQEAMAELIWRDAGFSSLWFSTQPLSYFENPSDGDGYLAFETVIKDVDTDFSYYDDWFTKNSTGGSLVQVDSDHVGAYGGGEGFIEALEETEYVKSRSEPTPQYLIIDAAELRERDFPPVVHEYDGYDADPADQSPDERVRYVARRPNNNRVQATLLDETDVHGHALIRDGADIIASATFGSAFGKTVDADFEVGQRGESAIIASLVDYREFPTPVSVHNELLEFDTHGALNPQTDAIATIGSSVATGRQTFECARALAVSPEYPQGLRRLLEIESSQPAVYRTAAIHLASGRNAILYGPPGTGKTRAATRLLGEGLGITHDFATAHGELTNYDIVGGYAPGRSNGDKTESGDSSTTIDWQGNPGIVTEAAEDCRERLGASGRHHWLVFDELNRANLDQAFGDIFTLLDIDYRTEQPLSYADEETYMPLSFRLLGTMNTEDQAKLFSLGGAFRRRFGFVPVPSLLDGALAETVTDERSPDTEAEQPAEAERIRAEIVTPAVKDDLTRVEVPVDDLGPQLHRRDAAAIDPVLAVEPRVKAAYETTTDPSTYGYADMDGLDVVLELAWFLQEHDLATVGHTHLIDVARFLTVAELIDEDGVDRYWLDEAVIAYVLPQLEGLLTRLREEQAIGRPEDDDDSLTARLSGFLGLLESYGLSRSRALIENREQGVGIV